MKTTLSILFVSFYFVSFGQNWADDVSTIFYQKCAQCHHTGGAAPFPLTTFAESNPVAAIIENALNNDEMPPWPPNNNYQSYSL